MCKAKQLSYIILCAASCFCLFDFYNTAGEDFERTAYASFLITAMYSLTGLMHSFSTSEEEFRLVSMITYFQMVLAAPCLACEIWLKHGVGQIEAAWGHVVIPVIMCCCYIINHQIEENLEQIVMGVTALSMGAVGAMNQNLFAVGSAVFFALGYFSFKNGYGHCENVSCNTYYNFAMAAFLVCGLFALK